MEKMDKQMMEIMTEDWLADQAGLDTENLVLGDIYVDDLGRWVRDVSDPDDASASYVLVADNDGNVHLEY